MDRWGTERNTCYWAEWVWTRKLGKICFRLIIVNLFRSIEINSSGMHKYEQRDLILNRMKRSFQIHRNRFVCKAYLPLKLLLNLLLIVEVYTENYDTMLIYLNWPEDVYHCISVLQSDWPPQFHGKHCNMHCDFKTKYPYQRPITLHFWYWKGLK